MAQFTAKKIDITKINGGEQIASGSAVTPELLNAPVNSALYTEKAIEVLTTQVDVSEIVGTGTPSVEFRTVTNGQETYKYLKFKNLRKDIKTKQAKLKEASEFGGLPEVTTVDAGSFLMVGEDGKWIVKSILIGKDLSV